MTGNPLGIAVERLPVELGAFLKLARIVASGGEAKRAVQDGDVTVNGERERRRRRQLEAGDIVAAFGRSYRVEERP